MVFSSPSGPVRASPRARAALTSSRTAARCASSGEDVFFSNGLTPTSVSVIADQASRPTLRESADQPRTTVQRTVPSEEPLYSVGMTEATEGAVDGAAVGDGGSGVV